MSPHPSFVAAVALAALSSLAPAASVQLNQNGVQSLTYNGFDFAQPANGDFGVALRFPTYTVAEWDHHSTTYGFQAPNTLVRSGGWGQATCQVSTQGPNVTFKVQVANLCSLPISQIHLLLMRMRFPGPNLPQGW